MSPPINHEMMSIVTFFRDRYDPSRRVKQDTANILTCTFLGQGSQTIETDDNVPILKNDNKLRFMQFLK